MLFIEIEKLKITGGDIGIILFIEMENFENRLHDGHIEIMLYIYPN